MRARLNPWIYKIRRAIQRPELVMSILRRTLRNVPIKLSRTDHLAFYREVMARRASKDPDRAIGSPDRQGWMEMGKLQFDYLVRHGLQPSHKLLEIGCGNLRAGWRFISYLEPGNYFGIDISPDILLAGERTIAEFNLQVKVPHLFPIDHMNSEFLPECYFDIIHAHSVFTHSPSDVIEACFANIGRIMKHNAFFDFTFFSSDGRTNRAYKVSNEDFYYPTSEMLALAWRHGLEAKVMDDWDYFQRKIRVTKLTK